jgi:hypothetical protein
MIKDNPGTPLHAFFRYINACYSAISPIQKQIFAYNLLIVSLNYYDFIAFLSGKIALRVGNSEYLIVNQ